MSTRFAGSRHLDERRRRRLAVEADEAAADSPSSAEAPELRRHVRETRTLTHFPLRKLISARRWKLWLVMFLLTLVGAGVVAGGTLATRPEAGLRADVATLLTPGGPVARTFGGTLLLIAAQVAVVIWWARSRSLHDYGGRYRVWLWTSATLVLWAFCHATGAHVVLGETAQWLWPLNLPAAATVYWLAPAGIWLLTVLRAVNQELGECRSSRLTLWLGAALLGGAAGLAMFPQFAVPVIERATIDAAVAILGHLLILTALVHHARHVIYVSPEAPPKPVPLWRMAVRTMILVLRAVRPRRRRRPSADGKPADEQRQPATKGSAASRPAKAAAADAKAARSRRTERARSTRATTSEPSDGDASASSSERATSAAAETVIEAPPAAPVSTSESRPPAAERRAPAAAPPELVESRADEEESDAEDTPPANRPGQRTEPADRGKSGPTGNVRIDSPVDKNALKGLSKRERRMLRKQLKDERRAAAGDE